MIDLATRKQEFFEKVLTRELGRYALAVKKYEETKDPDDKWWMDHYKRTVEHIRKIVKRTYENEE